MTDRVRLETPDGALWVRPDLVLTHFDLSSVRPSGVHHRHVVSSPSDRVEDLLAGRADPPFSPPTGD